MAKNNPLKQNDSLSGTVSSSLHSGDGQLTHVSSLGGQYLEGSRLKGKDIRIPSLDVTIPGVKHSSSDN